MLISRVPHDDVGQTFPNVFIAKTVPCAVPSTKDSSPVIETCRTAAELRTWLLKFARGLGFYGARYIQLGRLCWGLGDADSAQPIRYLSTSSQADREDEQWIRADPSIGQIRNAFAPFAWSTRSGQDVTPQQRAWLDGERSRGIDAGLTIPVQDSEGCPAYLNLFGIDEAAVRDLIDARAAELAFTAAQFHARAKALVPVAHWVGHGPKLSNREIECLRLAAFGQNVNESGQTLGISGRTVEFHLRNALDKLGAPTKIRAVVLAFGTGIVAAQA